MVNKLFSRTFPCVFADLQYFLSVFDEPCPAKLYLKRLLLFMSRANAAIAIPPATDENASPSIGDIVNNPLDADIVEPQLDVSIGIGGKKEFLEKFEKNIGKASQSKTSGKTRKAENLLRRSLNAYKKFDFVASTQYALDALLIDENHAQGHHILAMGLEKLGQLYKALQMYERSVALDPTDAEIYINLGLLAWKLDMLDGAERLFKIYIEMNPNHHSGYNNLAGIMRDRGQYDEAIEFLKAAIYRMPEQPELWNTMGTITMECGQVEEAKTFYTEALRLNPSFCRAYHNIAYILNHIGENQASLEHYDKALSLSGEANPDYVEMMHGRSVCKMHMGKLDESWKEYEIRHSPRFRGATVWAFNAPLWQGEDLKGKRIILAAEQGIGDEIMFANAFNEIIRDVGPEGKVFISCDERLVTLFARSFPEAVTGPHVGGRHNGKLARGAPWIDELGGVDYFCPFGTTLQYYRDDISKFPEDQVLLKPGPDRVSHWRDQLDALSDKPKVGICWRSMIMKASRSKYFSPMESWAPVLSNKDVTFINLQYGDCDEEIKTAYDLHGVTIHQLEGLDLKDDLDNNAALCAALDLVISAPTAASAIGGSVGSQLWMIAIAEVWPMLGTDTFPWYPNCHVFMPDVYRDWDDSMSKMGEALKVFSEEAKAR